MTFEHPENRAKLYLVHPRRHTAIIHFKRPYGGDPSGWIWLVRRLRLKPSAFKCSSANRKARNRRLFLHHRKSNRGGRSATVNNDVAEADLIRMRSTEAPVRHLRPLTISSHNNVRFWSKSHQFLTSWGTRMSR